MPRSSTWVNDPVSVSQQNSHVSYVVYTFNSSTLEIEAGRPQVQGQLGRQNKFQVSLSFRARSDLNKKQKQILRSSIAGSSKQYLYFSQIWKL